MEVHPMETSQGKNYPKVDLQRLKSTLCEGAQKAESCFSSAGIYRVPRVLRKLQKSAYTPRLIAIGPLHQNDKHLQTPMQHVKMSYANHLLCRLAEGVGNLEQVEQEKLTILRKCVAQMESLIDDAKKCYAQEVELNVEMMLVDGCFILELLYRNLAFRGDLRRADPIFGNKLTAVDVYRDLLLLENQIPFLVLEKLFPLTVGRIPSGLNRLSLTRYLILYFGKKMRSEGNASDCVLRVYGNEMENSDLQEEVPSRYHYHHILHKVHDGYPPPDQTGKNTHYEIMPSATELVYAGVKFVRGTEEDDLFKVKFKKPEGPFWWCRSASFEIPTLVMEDSTESFLRNLIAFEQCCSGVPQHFTSYAILMDMLVDSDKDVQVLEKAGILRNCLGASEDATNLFNKLCKEVVEGEFFFADICDRAHNYRRSFWPKNIAHVRRQYFASPWRFIAFCLAFCAVGISITQFFRSFWGHK